MSLHQNLSLAAYQVPEFLVQNIELYFNIQDDFTDVGAVIKFYRNPKSKESNQSVLLYGNGQEVLSVKYNGREEPDYKIENKNLIVPVYDNEFELSIKNRVYPKENKSFEGLYCSRGIYCTQCESEAFRNIMYFLDRPDVMTSYKVWIEASNTFEFLLSNGDMISEESLPNNRKKVCWIDPHKKPSYLFALVVGNLDKISKSTKTSSGKNVQLEVYVEKGNSHRAEHALVSLEKALKWDETRFGREYDLSTYMVVAVDDFNAGAMENKGLNIFNSKYVLASKDSATDDDYFQIESVIGHEYFHNWTGNRITCRDWFQISLKEGLTVFRDQEFSADLNSRTLVRIENVDRLRLFQFTEDASPTAHPIRPESAMSMDNLYTLTVYEKGAEVIRMIHTILGEALFTKSMDLYFSRHDGQAVRTEEFVQCMEDGSGIDLTQFKNWYHYAGTPTIEVIDSFKDSTYTLKLRQTTPATPGQSEKPNFHIPIKLGLVFKNNISYQPKLDTTSEWRLDSKNILLHLKEKETTLVFKDLPEKPYLSINRDFSAPVKIKKEWSEDELLSLMAKDENRFNQREACYQSMVNILLGQTKNPAKEFTFSADFLRAFKELLLTYPEDPHFIAKCLETPTHEYLFQFFDSIPLEALDAAVDSFQKTLATNLQRDFESIYENCVKSLSGPSEVGYRALKNRCLHYLSFLPELHPLIVQQAKNYKNMTDRLACLKALVHRNEPLKQEFFSDYYSDWAEDNLVMNNWFRVQAINSHINGIEDLKKLSRDPKFDFDNPNKIYSLHYAFGKFNYLGFHNLNGNAYEYIADCVLKIDKKNHAVAARLVSCFADWKKFDSKRQSLMKAQLERISTSADLSPNTFEIVQKSLAT